ncbi:MAG: hypothetical protein HWQ38_19145 [Nostoc sp. NMS7]|uniref:hypothetical protein n=1 Tax=Nostoc sp. NMS7 TaxID=2815391 RepID=UPI0025E05F4F|nr:hypothetical protein [Nostoc sp. NMS7]MBN3948453.1 hypothetical protein [Nostoc sp. NMS7]
MKINLNQKVKAKITDTGKVYLLRRYKRIFGNHNAPKFKLPEEDKDGYSVWQLWDLMGHFGEALRFPTLNVVIDPDIELIEEE